MELAEGNLAVRYVIMENGEVIDLARASIRHGTAVDGLADSFRRVIRKPCRVLTERTFRWPQDTHPFRIPDIAILCDFRSSNGVDYDGVPWLIAEVLSPSTESVDRGEKMELYAAVGVAEYWLFDPKTAVLQRYRLENGSMHEVDSQKVRDELEVSFLSRPELRVTLSDLL